MTFATPRDIQRLAEIEEVLLRLRQQAAGNAVVVEGTRDLAALETLGVGGTHIMVHQGIALEVLNDQIAHRAHDEGWQRVILLVDWDRTGGRLFRRLHDGLRARVPLEADLRRRLAQATHCKALEDVPAELASLRGRVAGRP